MTGAETSGKRRGALRPLAAVVAPLVRPAFRRRSPASLRILADWPMLVGPAIAARVEPTAFARGVLTVSCDGPAALELQHAAALLAERINVALGERCVERVVIRQTRLAAAPAGAAPAARPAPPVPVAPIAGFSPELGVGLARLAAAIRARDRA